LKRETLELRNRGGSEIRSKLYVIVDVDACERRGWLPQDFARACLAGGARLLQVRAKTMGGAAFLRLVSDVVAQARELDAQVIVNDRADIAVLAGATGVHVGQDDLSVDDVRRIVGPEMMVGLSTHTVEQLADAVQRAISYVAIGPVFGTSTKDTGYEAVGVEMVRQAARLASPQNIPVVAIGGMTLERAPAVWAAGAASAAVITDLFEGDPTERVTAWLALSRA
jgi:thiamine-phosphate pyrophosphorylase